MNQAIDDSTYPIRLKSPLGQDLVVANFSGVEEVSRLFAFDLECLSDKGDIAFSDIVGQRVTVEVELDDGQRYFDGYVTEFSAVGFNGTHWGYRAVVRPWLWFLGRTADCRVFQKDIDGIKTVPDIIKAVFRDNGMSDFRDELGPGYREWIYCVQYRETDFNFVSRLMEQEGIWYYFEHQDGKHILVMVDDNNALKAFPGYDTIKFFDPAGGPSTPEVDHLQHWRVGQAIQPSSYALADYDFEHPKVPVRSLLTNEQEVNYVIQKPEVFDYPGEYKKSADGDLYVKHRLHELQAQHERANCGGPNRGLAPGHTFTLENHGRDDQNREYIVLAASYQLSNASFLAGAATHGAHYRMDAEVLPKSVPFRPERTTPKPLVQGCQTAVVVGPDGEEIHCDEFGRVRAQFHWDRYGKKDEKSSCWIRVSQPWAGKGWGGVWIPRIGQEVIVSFLEGDPDQPIITGRVYNADQTTPYGLPGNKTQSGFKSNSSPGGGGWNELRFEDKKGSEEVFIQAEKDETINVKNNKKETVGNNETISIGNDRKETVGHNETIEVGNDRVENVGKDETLTVVSNRTRNVGVNETVTVGGNRSHTVGGSETITIGVAQAITVTAAQNLAIGAAQAVEVGGAKTESIGAYYGLDVGAYMATEVGATWSMDIGSNLEVQTGKKLDIKCGSDTIIDAGDSITLKCGAASIVMKKSGDITIKGKNLVLKGNGKVDVKANQTLNLKGMSVKEN